MRQMMIALIAVTIWVSPGFAQCGGWVLWREQFGLSGASTWIIEAGAPDFKACASVMQQQIDATLKANSAYRLFPNRQNFINRFDQQTNTWIASDGYRYVCLPDTISDPRSRSEQK